ncbi:sulfurtransferase TusA family protein [Oceaniovalibus guishaninsula]|nr:sulfurtransferase TusA family protein [Oceaniovalibus guishaninsula]
MIENATSADAIVDARGLLCPLPVLKARKRLAALSGGQVLQLVADDPAAVVDVPHFCAQAGHTLLSVTERDGARVYLLKRGA